MDTGDERSSHARSMAMLRLKRGNRDSTVFSGTSARTGRDLRIAVLDLPEGRRVVGAGDDRHGRRRLALSIAAVTIALACGAPVRSVPSHAPVENSPAALERATVDAVNRERERRGLAPLAVSSALTLIARAHSAYQAMRKKPGHKGEGGSSPADRAEAGGVSWSVIAENVAMNSGYSDPVATAVRGWMKSAGHRENILNPVFEQTGVGIVAGEDGTIYFTQMFLDPAN